MASETLDELYTGGEEGRIIDPHRQFDYFKEAEPLKDNLKEVERGRLDRKTGMLIPLSSKACTILTRNLLPSQKYLENFDLIKWDTESKE